MRSRQIISVILLLPLLSGCIYSREITSTQRAIARQNPEVRFDRQFSLSVGQGSIGVLSELAAFGKVDESKLASDYLRTLRKIKVGVYELEGPISPNTNLTTLPHFRRAGWETLARVRADDGENVAVLYRERFGQVRDLFIIALDDPSLVIVRVTGNFTEMVTRALADFSDRTEWSGLFRDRRNGQSDDSP